MYKSVWEGQPGPSQGPGFIKTSYCVHNPFTNFHITAPGRNLTRPAKANAAGDLNQGVKARTGDEIVRLARAFNTMARALCRQMTTDIAQELRTPSSLAQGGLEAILDGMYEINLENVTPVHEETLVLTRLVNDLRDLALAEAGQLRLKQEIVDVADLVTGSVERFRTQAAEQGVSLATDLAPGLTSVRADLQRLSQVLINMLSNALRHTPADGRVVEAARLASAEEQGSRRERDMLLRSPPPLPLY